MKVIITGGAGFVGSSLALRLKAGSSAGGGRVVALDNLKRRGSELNLPRLKAAGVEFVHGDIRDPADLEAVGAFDLLIECSAEPSVHAGYGESPRYLIDSNLMGTINCLESARKNNAAVLFLSTSRVYSIEALRDIALAAQGNRLAVTKDSSGMRDGEITEEFSTKGPRSLYGATKLASEMIIEEYAAMYGLKAMINRCGVITGPWQMGKVDQGFFVLWLSRHLWKNDLKYMGFGGAGHQVRDFLHVEDLADLVELQIKELSSWRADVFNVGGGLKNSVSLLELTKQIQSKFNLKTSIGTDAETRAADIPYYVGSNARVSQRFGWRPKRDLDQTLEDIFTWLRENESSLKPILG